MSYGSDCSVAYCRRSSSVHSNHAHFNNDALGIVKEVKKLRSDLVGIATEFGNQLCMELNYVQEAQNCLRFRELYQNVSGVYVPTAYPELTTTKVLTMEFVEGI
jgi:predicted unusual protein kinase regulating ubiquinone biosynthesis (AarF/ABC1/UbiB family)